MDFVVTITIAPEDIVKLNAWIAQLDNAEKGLSIQEILTVRLNNETKSMITQAEHVSQQDIATKYSEATPEQKTQIQVILAEAKPVPTVGLFGKVINFFTGNNG